MVEQWRLLEGAFTQVLGITLEDEFPNRSWRWVTTHVNTHLNPDCAVARAVAPEPKSAPETE
jgi:ribonuclease HI